MPQITNRESRSRAVGFDAFLVARLRYVPCLRGPMTLFGAFGVVNPRNAILNT